MAKKKEAELLTVAEQHYVKSFQASKTAEELAGELSVPVEKVESFLAHLKSQKRGSLPLPKFKEGTYYMTEAMSMVGDKSKKIKTSNLDAQIAEAVASENFVLADELKRRRDAERASEVKINPALEPHISPTYRDR